MQRTALGRQEQNPMPALQRVDALYATLVLVLVAVTMAAYGLIAVTA
jgi:hypothetical protein